VRSDIDHRPASGAAGTSWAKMAALVTGAQSFRGSRRRAFYFPGTSTPTGNMTTRLGGAALTTLTAWPLTAQESKPVLVGIFRLARSMKLRPAR
jgi:hypothetical protein